MKDLDLDVNVKWPKINTNLLEDEKIDYVIQINGKKRAILNEICNFNFCPHLGVTKIK